MSHDPIKTAAFNALRNAGLRQDDPDLVKLFDTSGITVENGRAFVPPDFTSKAMSAKPELFGLAGPYRDARTMTDAEWRSAQNDLRAVGWRRYVAFIEQRDSERIAKNFASR